MAKIEFESAKLKALASHTQIAAAEGDMEYAICSPKDLPCAGDGWPDDYCRLVVVYNELSFGDEVQEVVIHDEVHGSTFAALAQMHLIMVNEYTG